MFKLTIWLLVVICVLANSGCAYTLKETGHRDLDRSVRFCDQWSACFGRAFTYVGGWFVGEMLDEDDDETTTYSGRRYQDPQRPSTW
jgi:hypothetical protein